MSWTPEQHEAIARMSPESREQAQAWFARRYLALLPDRPGERRLSVRVANGARRPLGQRKHARSQWAVFWRTWRKCRQAGDGGPQRWSVAWWPNDWHHRERRRLTRERQEN